VSERCERCEKNPVVPGSMLCRACVEAAVATPPPQRSLFKAMLDHNRKMYQFTTDAMREASARIEEQIDNDSSPPDSERRIKTRERKSI